MIPLAYQQHYKTKVAGLITLGLVRKNYVALCANAFKKRLAIDHFNEPVFYRCQ
jgi:hypothetical protein